VSGNKPQSQASTHTTIMDRSPLHQARSSDLPMCACLSISVRTAVSKRATQLPLPLPCTDPQSQSEVTA
jgi:hypothetical protein